MHGLALLLEVTGLTLLVIEAVERRAARWKLELEEARAAMQGQRWVMRRTGQLIFLLIAIEFASVVARFDQWKDRHKLSDLFFLFALACGVSGVALSVAFS